MLTITDLAADLTLDTAAMSDVRGGVYMPAIPYSFESYYNGGRIDAGVHALAQGQTSLVSQAGNLGGFNLAAGHQSQNGISGQLAF